MDFKRYLKKGQIKTLVFILCIFLIAAVILAFDAVSYRIPNFDGCRSYYEPNWMFGEKGGRLSETRLSEQHEIEPGKTYILSTTLTYSGDGDDYPCALLTVGNYEIRVYLDGTLMYEYTRGERGFPRVISMGGAAFTIPLGNHCQGRELLLELTTSMDYASTRRMPGVLLGDYSVMMQRLFLSNVPNMLISLAIFFVVVVLVLLGNANEQKRCAYMHFSAFALVILVYRGTQDLFLMYIWSNPILSIALEQFSLILCPLPILLSYYYELKPYYRRTLRVLILLTLTNFLVQLMLHFTGICDVVTMLNFNNVWIVVCGVILTFIAIQVRRQDSSVHCMRKLIPILAGAVMDFLAFYIRFHTIGPGSFFVVGQYIGLGLLTSLIMMVWEARQEREKAFAEYERTQLLEKMAYKDALTGIENRAAYTREIDRIHEEGHKDQKFLVVAADLNGLKITNDTEGHAAGDALLQRAADLLYDSFRDYGHVYRTGGDEFFAILSGVTEAQWQMLEVCFYRELEERNQNHQKPLSIALGHAFMETTIDQCIQLADKRMYENKKKIKEENRMNP